jgi:flagellar motility protein MotE (MotC chaperone)
MKPPEAAAILASMDDTVAARICFAMDERKAAAVLAAMPSERAARITLTIRSFAAETSPRQHAQN